MPEPLLLREANAQEIQLEVVRRVEFNSFYGESVANDLMSHRELWESVIVDREYPRFLKLRDLSTDTWNVDGLYILAPNPESVIKLLILAKRWCPDGVAVLTEKETGDALGSSRIGQKRLICMHWD